MQERIDKRRQGTYFVGQPADGLKKVAEYFDNTPSPNLFAFTTCHMKMRPYLVSCKQTNIGM